MPKNRNVSWVDIVCATDHTIRILPISILYKTYSYNWSR